VAETVRVLATVRDVPREAWDALVADESPFLEWEWLAALEDGRTVTRETGWLPQHVTLWDGERLVGAAPLYVKAHSMGEFVFDHTWATAARRAGIDYYPKLLVAVPFTPVTGARFLARPADAAHVRATLAAVLERLCAEGDAFSSVHVNFCRPADAEALAARGWLRRTAYQYQWRNDGYRIVDDTSRACAASGGIRRVASAARLDEQGVEIRTYVGAAIPGDVAEVVYRLYRRTVDDNAPAISRARLLRSAFERFRERICLVLAYRAGEVVAGTFNVQKGDALYGRYWGAFETLRHLHFNVCYYAAIEHCIAAGLARFEPGAGGEFKHLRGFDATETVSMHWIRDRRFRAAVADYLVRERAAVANEIEWFTRRHLRGSAIARSGVRRAAHARLTSRQPIAP
jgi:predicted N-acyltransferase